MILGTHNSWSYLREREWWMILTRPLAKCQEFGIATQFHSGARCFDLRVRWSNKAGCFIPCHGITTYKGDYKKDLLWLNNEAEKRGIKVYVRILLEDSGRVNRLIDDSFFDLCHTLDLLYRNIVFFGGWPARERWRKYIYRFLHDFKVEEIHASVSGRWYEKIPFVFSRLHNKQILEKGTSSDVLMIDFL